MATAASLETRQAAEQAQQREVASLAGHPRPTVALTPSMFLDQGINSPSEKRVRRYSHSHENSTQKPPGRRESPTTQQPSISSGGPRATFMQVTGRLDRMFQPV
ncbi:hypothetical protein GCM10010207_66070 [Streptomyces atratus]|nr:hypothetical protein GCM10010207_66070 [Streptomyces atratus]